VNILLVNRMMGVAWGGGENFDYHVARGLQERGHQVLVLTGKPRGESGSTIPTDIETMAVEGPYLRKYMYQWAGKIRLLPGLMAELDLTLFGRTALDRLHGIVKQRGIHVIQVLALPRLAKRLLAEGHPVGMRFPGPPAWFQLSLLKRLARNQKMLMYSHGDTVEYFQSRLGLSIEEVPPGVQTDVFHPASPEERSRIRTELGFSKDDFLLVTSGRLIPGKGHSFLLRGFRQALGRVGNLRLLVIGGGPLQPALEQEARQLGVTQQLRFLGHQDRGAVAMYLSASDLFCLFSEYENFSNAVLEAMATGLPVMATRVGGFPLQIESGRNGYLIEPGDEAGFVRRVAELSEAIWLRGQLSRKAIQFAQQFSWKVSAGQLAALYERLVRR